MKKTFSINDKKYLVTAWNLGAEKEALLSFGDGLANASLKNKIEVLLTTDKKFTSIKLSDWKN